MVSKKKIHYILKDGIKECVPLITWQALCCKTVILWTYFSIHPNTHDGFFSSSEKTMLVYVTDWVIPVAASVGGVVLLGLCSGIACCCRRSKSAPRYRRSYNNRSYRRRYENRDYDNWRYGRKSDNNWSYAQKYDKVIIWASTLENLSSVVFEQQRCRPACASAQSDQRLGCSLFGKYQI